MKAFFRKLWFMLIYRIKVPLIKCPCGRVIKPPRGIVTIRCKCGSIHRLCKAGRPIKVLNVEQS